jgi:hypothetical protein
VEGPLATVITSPQPRPRNPAPFPLRHPWDHNFFLVVVILIWAGVLGGFVPEIVHHLTSGAPPFPHILHVHGAAFVGWLVLLTVQLFLIRNRQVQLHRKVGLFGAALAVVMVPLGIVTSLTMDRLHMQHGEGDPSFFSVQLLDMVEFGLLAAAAISARKSASAHKRLILLATLSITDAGFARWLGVWLHGYLGEGVWQFFLELFGAGSGILILALGAYDWITRRRLHPAYVYGALFVFAGQITASWLYYDPSWKALSTSIVRAWPFA